MKSSKLLKLPPFNADLYLKRTIAVCYYKDANDLLWRTKVVDDNLQNTLSIRAKMYVDLIMALECSLKSMVISLSPKSESPENSYLQARQCSHNLIKLYDVVKKKAKNRIKLLNVKDEAILIEANSLGVGYRYDFMTFIFLSQEEWVDRVQKKGKISSIINMDFISKLNTLAHKMHDISKVSLDRYLGWYARVHANRLSEISTRHNEFVQKLGGRL